jgi:hypothetical protein
MLAKLSMLLQLPISLDSTFLNLICNLNNSSFNIKVVQNILL